MEKRVNRLLVDLGVPCNFEGFALLSKAIEMSIFDREYLKSVTKKLYPKVGEAFGCPPSRAERNMRYAVEACFSRCDEDFIQTVFGRSVSSEKGKLTNSEFIAGAVEYLKHSEVGT